MDSIPENGGEVKRNFEQVKRAFETAYANREKRDYSPELIELSTAIAYSVLKKCIDPQRTTAPSRDTVSNNGYNPALTDLRRGIASDLSTLDNTRQAADKATHGTLDKNGEPITKISDKAAYDA